MSNVLITGINYWPEPTGVAPYTTQVAEHLHDLGHRVTVITGMPHYPSWSVAPGYRHGPYRQVRNGVCILRQRHHVPTHQTALQRGRYEVTFLAGALRRRIGARPAVVIGVSPSLSGAVLARRLASRFRSPYGVIVQDLMGRATEQSGIKGGRVVSRITREIERWSVEQARHVAAVSESFFPYLAELGVQSERLMHLPNWTHMVRSVADRAETRRRLGWNERTHVVLHAGNMGLKQGLEQVIEAARLAAGRTFQFVLMGDGSQRRLLEERARGLPNLSFLNLQSAEEYPDVLAAADVLLVSERPTVVDMSLPSKLTSYFDAHRPVLAAVPPHGATAREVHRSGGGLVVPAGDAAALLAALTRLSSDPVLSSRLAEAGRRYACRELTRDAALLRIGAFVQAVMQSRRLASRCPQA